MKVDYIPASKAFDLNLTEIADNVFILPDGQVVIFGADGDNAVIVDRREVNMANYDGYENYVTFEDVKDLVETFIEERAEAMVKERSTKRSKKN